jgi:hypothetical protein
LEDSLSEVEVEVSEVDSEVEVVDVATEEEVSVAVSLSDDEDAVGARVNASLRQCPFTRNEASKSVTREGLTGL